MATSRGQAADLLRRAIQVLGERGWFQGAYCDYSKPVESAPVCLYGAINVADHGSPGPGGGTTAAMYARGAVIATLGSSDPASWNDEKGRTVDDVVHVLNKTIWRLEH